MGALTGVPRTLLFTLRARAEEHVHPESLFVDPVAADWYASIALDAAAKTAMQTAYSPVFQLATAVRTILYDNITTNFLKQHPDGLIVELGAGLSTRVYRLRHLGGHWVVLDLPQAIDFRKQFEQETESLTQISTSMLDPLWLTNLPPTPPQNILFIAEAVLFFVAPTDVAALVTLLKTRFPGATFAFDVLTQQFSPKARARFLAADAPMLWLVQAEKEVAALDLTIQEQWIVTHHYLARWHALGLQPERLLADKGNIIFHTCLDYNK